MKRLLWILGGLVLLSGCGKNDGFRSTGYAPPPGGYGPYAPPPGGYPGPYGYPPSGYGPFNPYQRNPGLPSYGYPYAPIYPYLTGSGVWQPWVQYCRNRGWDPYQNFQYFWLNYCPKFCEPSVYDYYNSNFYSWMTPNVQFPYSGNSGTFWPYYDGMPGYCGNNCG